MNRRHFLATATATALVPHLFGQEESEPLFKISLAQWSNHRMLKAGKISNLEWPEYTRKTYDIHALEYVNQFFKDKAEDESYLAELNKRVSDLGMSNVLIMIDGEGHIGAKTEEGRNKTVDQHKRWVTAAKTLGCHSIRVNAYGDGSPEEAAKQVTDGLHKLATFAADHDINVIVENHGGNSSNGEWLSGVLSAVNLPNCGSLPDFGNFHGYDRYQGIRDLMPFAKGVSAKSREFDEAGNEVQTDFQKAMKIVLDAKYRGYVGVEYEGGKHSEDEGIKLTKALLEKVREDYQG
ncbi:sugar phosphate isomerase/epimerase family protein [Roseibacillus ishigakijimensis]|uniref:TIM barrel protein n=1 Tax=Roseibacillus ishigakijimensis TaxID=454146 RepID=A0A934RQE7_9BACT|nr:sugar phosphate isomerase/epimerase family protein [Roseibacillus ishigakijimensis]MBK1833967.1 TIM barrel protein [Roseibacillus ishigakijimensis]